MNIKNELLAFSGFSNLDVFANQIVEGFISGTHKSPFHGFSSEFAEHKIYNTGESTKHIDWKLYARTDKLYKKRFEDETNLRCHIILDNSSSMHFPKLKLQNSKTYNKAGFSVLAAAALMQLLKRQRDAVGLSIYSDVYDYYAPEKGSERHRHMLIKTLEDIIKQPKQKATTDAYTHLHLIAEKLQRRSLVFLFSDMFQTEQEHSKLFDALRHLKHNKHEVILFHVYNGNLEMNLDFDNTPRKFIDVETGAHINLYPDAVKMDYSKAVKDYFKSLALHCGRYKIKYEQADITKGFNSILTRYLLERQKFI